MTQSDAQLIRQTLDQHDPDRTYLTLLQTLAVVGVADKPQLERATRLSRNQLARLIQKMNHCSNTPLVDVVAPSIPRAGTRGRAPKVYRLTDTGAALIRAHPCALTDPIAIAHALALLDLYLVAQQHQRPIVIDQPVSFGTDRVIRPDAVITLEGTRTLFEIEQAASPDLLRRIVESLRHKYDFFTAAPKRYSNVIRMLLALPRGEVFEQTIRVWQHALHLVATQVQRALPFRLGVLPLAEFLAQPDWNPSPDPTRWREVQPRQPASAVKQSPAMPALPRRSAQDDALILKSLWYFVQERAANLGRAPHADPAFFEVIRVIYIASHDSALSLHAQARFPDESLWLLRHYLAMHPSLKQMLDQLFKRSAWAGRASVPLTLQRMQSIINAFLEYHGWRSYGPLSARATLVNWDAEEPQGFGVTVQIAPALLNDDPDAAWQDRALTERALAWVLWALFNYAPHLGFDGPTFW